MNTASPCIEPLTSQAGICPILVHLDQIGQVPICPYYEVAIGDQIKWMDVWIANSGQYGSHSSLQIQSCYLIQKGVAPVQYARYKESRKETKRIINSKSLKKQHICLPFSVVSQRVLNVKKVSTTLIKSIILLHVLKMHTHMKMNTAKRALRTSLRTDNLK